MSLLQRAKDVAGKVGNKALESAELIALSASETGLNVAETIGDRFERKALEPMPVAVGYFLQNETALLLLADAISAAEAAADENTPWTEIVKAALVDLQSEQNGD